MDSENASGEIVDGETSSCENAGSAKARDAKARDAKARDAKAGGAKAGGVRGSIEESGRAGRECALPDQESRTSQGYALPDQESPTGQGAALSDQDGRGDQDPTLPGWSCLTDRERAEALGLLDFIQACPSMFHTAAELGRRFDEAGFTYLPEGKTWDVESGGCYWTSRNGSSVIAFKVGECALSERDAVHFQLTASHGDSPTFKVKSAAELDGPACQPMGRDGSAPALLLNVEAYGGVIDHTWFDRPLSVAGRVLVRTGGRIESRLVAPDRDLAIIPSVAIHLDRSVNKQFSPDRARDLRPLISAGLMGKGSFDEIVAREVGVDVDDVLARDLFLVNRVEPRLWGAAEEFVSSSKLDDLMCAYASLQAFLQAHNDRCITVYCCFDNEEVGSNTKQGAMSTFLVDTLQRLAAALGLSREGYLAALSRSMLVSCDNAHAVHPNRPDLYDAGNRCFMNGGLVVKEAANQHYCTDAFSRAALIAVLDAAGLPHQSFANRSDMAGGSTLGNLSNIQVSLHAVDVGCAQLAMHSAYETAGSRDVLLAERSLKAFFEANLTIDGSDSIDLGI